MKFFKHPTGVVEKYWLIKSILIMKLTIALIFLLNIQAIADVYSQTKVTLNLKSADFKKVISAIEKQSSYHFVYSDRKIPVDKKIDINADNEEVLTILGRLLANSGFTYNELANNLIVIAPVGDQIKANVITGTVTDEKGVPLPGATVKIKGAKTGIATSASGTFTLEAPDNAVLVVSFIGFADKEVIVKGTNPISIILTALDNSLTEVVVVGYGTQRKVDLTGSVATVSSEEINKRAAPNVGNLLQGKVTGLDIVQSTGQPGKDAPNIQIRGLGTYGANANGAVSSGPLILIDGVLGDLNLISPIDIESVSVLKDAASSAIYGNRAANGVILVTTKRGKAGATNITYSNVFSINQPSRLPDLIWNSAEYMQDFNLAREHSGQTDIYTQAQINLYKNAPAGSTEYPNFNYVNYYINNSFSQNHHLGVSGGNDNTNYNISAGYLNQNGIIKNTNANRYNMLFSLDSKLNKTFKVGGTVSFAKQDIVEPWLSNDDLVLLIYQSAPTYEPFLPDGSGRYSNNDFYDPAGNYGAGHNRSPEYTLDNGNLTTNNYQAKGQAYIETTILKDLTWNVKGAFTYNDQFVRNYQYASAEYYYHADPTLGYVETDNGGPTSVGVSNRDERNLYLNAYSTLNYKTTIAKDHHISALAGYSVETYTDQFLYGQRSTFPATTLTQLTAGATTGQNLDGDSYQYALQSFFGRVNYDYKEKYLLEINARYDGTSRIAPAYRYGLFPSASVGWRINQEDFLKDVSWLSNLKVRGSYGKLGNQDIGYYPYQAIYNSSGVQYSYTSQNTQQGVVQQTLVDNTIRWETTNITDLGFDVDIKNGLFTATFDWYNKKTSGVLSQPNVVYSIGLSPPTVNDGVLQNRGFELNLGHANKIGKNFRYSTSVLFSLNRNKLLQINGGTQDNGMQINQVGQPYGSFYLTQWNGIFNSQAEINSSPVQQYTPKPGDLKYVDANGDGKIDQNDRVIVKGIYPDYSYSFNLNVGYKNFDLTTFWQGVQGIKRYVNGWGYDPFLQGSTPPTFFRDAWTPENHSQTVPALYTYGYGPVDGISSTYFLKDASYLRLKNVQLTYHIPVLAVKKIGLKNASVYLSGDNLATFTKFPGDPERLQLGQNVPGLNRGSTTRYAQYPQVRMFSAGLNVQF